MFSSWLTNESSPNATTNWTTVQSSERRNGRNFQLLQREVGRSELTRPGPPNGVFSKGFPFLVDGDYSKLLLLPVIQDMHPKQMLLIQVCFGDFIVICHQISGCFVVFLLNFTPTWGDDDDLTCTDFCLKAEWNHQLKWQWRKLAWQCRNNQLKMKISHWKWRFSSQSEVMIVFSGVWLGYSTG